MGSKIRAQRRVPGLGGVLSGMPEQIRWNLGLDGVREQEMLQRLFEQQRQESVSDMRKKIASSVGADLRDSTLYGLAPGRITMDAERTRRALQQAANRLRMDDFRRNYSRRRAELREERGARITAEFEEGLAWKMNEAFDSLAVLWWWCSRLLNCAGAAAFGVAVYFFARWV